jgi:hypothetical protein
VTIRSHIPLGKALEFCKCFLNQQRNLFYKGGNEWQRGKLPCLRSESKLVRDLELSILALPMKQHHRAGGTMVELSMHKLVQSPTPQKLKDF